MGKQKQEPPESEGDQIPAPEPTKGAPAPTTEAPKSGVDRDLVKSVLAELAQSGELFGGTGKDDAPGEPPDLEAAIARVLDRRDAESKARETEQERDKTLTDLKEAVGKGLGRARRWFEPASPWGE